MIYKQSVEMKADIHRPTMAAILLLAIALLRIAFPASLEAASKESTVDMRKMNRIFLGWVDLKPETLVLYGHSTPYGSSSKAEWTEVESSLNAVFRRSCQSKYLPGRTITGAKDKEDENAADNDLYVKFSDVFVDMDNYQLRLSIHFIDPKTNSEIASIPVRTYSERVCDFVNCLRGELDKVGVKLQAEITGEPKEKKKK
jgi:hypothetical protein